MPSITAKACLDAAELLAEREEIAEQLARMRSAVSLRIEYGRAYSYEPDPLPDHAPKPKGQRPKSIERIDWQSGPEMKPTPSLMALLTGSIEETLSGIDASLRALGVEPPPLTPIRQREDA